MSSEILQHKLNLDVVYIKNRRKYGYQFIKRSQDILFSLIGIILLLPLFIIIAFLIKLTSPGSIIYRQERIGRFNQPFYIYKFRTMLMNADQFGELITARHDERITKVGHFLRKYKLDELPQLFNVLIGTMSLVGPRPEVSKYVKKNPAYQTILVVKPGITDVATLQYRNEEEILDKIKAEGKSVELYYNKIIIPNKIKLSREYITNRSFQLDLQILVKTLFSVILHKQYEINLGKSSQLKDKIYQKMNTQVTQ